MTETSDAIDAGSVVRISPPAFRAFYDLRRQTTPGARPRHFGRAASRCDEGVRSRTVDRWPARPGGSPAFRRRPDHFAAVRESPSIELRPDFRGQVHEFPQSLPGEPALFLQRSQLQLALEQNFHDFVVLYG